MIGGNLSISLWRKLMFMINYIQMLIFNVHVLQMPLSIYVKTETIIDMMYLQVLI